MREEEAFKVWILVKELYGICVWICMDLYGIHVELGIFQPLSLSICRLGKP